MVKKISLLTCLILGMLACENHSSDFEASIESAAMEEMQDEQIEAPRTAQPPPPALEATKDEQQIRNTIEKASKIIKDGRISVEVEDLKAAKTAIDSTLKNFNAYYEKENYQSQTYRSTYQLTIRIPSENFASFLKNIENGAGRIVEKNIDARDVTEEYVDIAIRLNNNRIYLQRYQELLKKANSIKDILAIQEKIRTIASEIEARKGRLQYFDDRVRFSTLRIALSERHQVTKERQARNFGKQIVHAFQNGIDAFLDFLLFLVNIWPFILVLALILAFRKRIRWRFWKKAN